MPEFPLSLRLIGLRVTKLKDLKDDEKRGIKRVRLIYPIAVRRDRIPTRLWNSSSSQLARKRVRESGGEPAEIYGARTVTTSPVLVGGSVRRRIDFSWVE